MSSLNLRLLSLVKRFSCVLALAFLSIGVVSADTLRIETGLDESGLVRLTGADARRQIIVMADGERGSQDVTRQVAFKTAPEGIVQISDTGYLTPIGAGKASVTVVSESHQSSCNFDVEVDGFENETAINFPNQIVPVFTKFSCNGGGCHGKAAGQNGFRLSLLGFHPQDDYEFLVKESRGRRLFPAMPEKSLLLTKATSQVPHGGGKRLDENTDEYRLLKRWISQGMPYGSDDDPKVESIVVYPENRVMNRESSQQLIVFAHYTDGHIKDVTRMAQFESNDTEMADVDMQGLVSTRDLAGDVTVMTRFQGQVAVFRAILPLSEQAPTLPTPNNLVDQAVFAKLTQLGIPTSSNCSDETFIRRITLDLAGRLPTLDETKEFLAETSDNKRQQVITRLLSSDDYAEFFASKWAQILRNKRDNDSYKFGTFAMYEWLREQLYHNRPYNELVRDIIAASGSVTVHPPVAWYRQVTDVNQQVEDASQLFLGQRIQCARCHHHPYEKWSQQDYAKMAGFFSLVSKKAGPTPSEPIVYSRIGRPSAADPRSGAQLVPAGLGAEPINVDDSVDPRHELVDWMTESNNPYFAPALVNRYWKHFFGRGLVDPEDDMRVTNPASNPELLENLSQQFFDSGFDLKQLIRMIVESKTYQLSSDANDLNLDDRRNHSRFYPKRMQAEVLLDSIDQVLGTSTAFEGMPVGTRAVSLPDTSFNSYFLTVFGRPEATTACECERTTDSNLAQSLHLLNSKEMQAKLTDPNGFAFHRSQRIDTEKAETNQEVTSQSRTELIQQDIESIYLIAFSRLPSSEETSRLVNYISNHQDPRAAYEDALWAVVNSKEFLFNH